MIIIGLSSTFDYFGARYYDSELSVWLSVDPMSDRRPGLSAYNYVQWNPLNRIDPTGMLDWKPVGDGKWEAEKGDGAETLARDAGISREKAYRIMEEQGHGTYKDSDGVIKSDVDTGDVVHVPTDDQVSPTETSGDNTSSENNQIQGKSRTNKSPNINERTTELFSQYNIGYLSDNRSRSELPNQKSPITPKHIYAGVAVGYLSIATKSPILTIFATYYTAAEQHQYLLSQKHFNNYQRHGNDMGMYVANIIGPGAPIPRAAMFSAYNGAFIGWHQTTIKGAPELQYREFQQLLRKTRQ